MRCFFEQDLLICNENDPVFTNHGFGIILFNKNQKFQFKTLWGGIGGGGGAGGGRRASSKNDIDNSGTILIGLTGGDAYNYVYICLTRDPIYSRYQSFQDIEIFKQNLD